jgi:hypothetical protein
VCGCAGKVPSQAKHSRQGSFCKLCHLRPNIPDRVFFCKCGCVGNVPSQAKHLRLGSFIECVAVRGRCHLRPNIRDRGLFVSCIISGQTFQTGVFFCKCGCVGNVPSQAKHSRQGSFIECVAVRGRCHLRPNIRDRGLFVSCIISGQTFQTGVFSVCLS